MQAALAASSVSWLPSFLGSSEIGPSRSRDRIAFGAFTPRSERLWGQAPALSPAARGEDRVERELLIAALDDELDAVAARDRRHEGGQVRRAVDGLSGDP